MSNRETIIRTAINDPGQFLPRLRDERGYESIGAWGARAVLKALEEEFQLVDEVRIGDTNTHASTMAALVFLDSRDGIMARRMDSAFRAYQFALSHRVKVGDVDNAEGWTEYPSLEQTRAHVASFEKQ